MLGLPRYALSVRQPWAHALVMGWKPVENREWSKLNPGLKFKGPFCVHASCGLTQKYYERAAEFIAAQGFTCPPAAELLRGGIVGVATVTGATRQSASPWFFGPWALTLADARQVKFVPVVGQLGFWEWREAEYDTVPEPARWMMPKPMPTEQLGLALPDQFPLV